MAFPCFELLYMAFAVDKMDGHGLIKTAHCESDVVLATEGLP